jgi:hypothetical protein
LTRFWSPGFCPGSTLILKWLEHAKEASVLHNLITGMPAYGPFGCWYPPSPVAMPLSMPGIAQGPGMHVHGGMPQPGYYKKGGGGGENSLICFGMLPTAGLPNTVQLFVC